MEAQQEEPRIRDTHRPPAFTASAASVLAVLGPERLREMLPLLKAPGLRGACRIVRTLDRLDSEDIQALAFVVLDCAVVSEIALHAEKLTRWPAPGVVAIGPDSEQLAALNRMGAPPMLVLDRKIGATELADSLSTLARDFVPMRAAVCSLVGHVGMKDVQRYVRWLMLREGLSLTHYNRGSAASLLDVTRSAVQQMIRTLDVPVR